MLEVFSSLSWQPKTLMKYYKQLAELGLMKYDKEGAISKKATLFQITIPIPMKLNEIEDSDVEKTVKAKSRRK